MLLSASAMQALYPGLRRLLQQLLPDALLSSALNKVQQDSLACSMSLKVHSGI